MTAGFGGGCHWCTEAVFASLKGVKSVKQGWISSEKPNDGFSEAVLVDFDADEIPFETLIEIHLHTHSSTSEHSMRGKYRSAVYVFSDEDSVKVKKSLQGLQRDFERKSITQVLPFASFEINKTEQLDYYYSDPKRPFCEVYIDPKLKILMEKFSDFVNLEKIDKSR